MDYDCELVVHTHALDITICYDSSVPPQEAWISEDGTVHVNAETFCSIADEATKLRRFLDGTV